MAGRTLWTLLLWLGRKSLLLLIMCVQVCMIRRLAMWQSLSGSYQHIIIKNATLKQLIIVQELSSLRTRRQFVLMITNSHLSWNYKINHRVRYIVPLQYATSQMNLIHLLYVPFSLRPRLSGGLAPPGFQLKRYRSTHFSCLSCVLHVSLIFYTFKNTNMRNVWLGCRRNFRAHIALQRDLKEGPHIWNLQNSPNIY
jgi:hypothetical protein